MTPDRPDSIAAGLLPLKSVEALILMMLTIRDRHGYGLRQDILEFSKGSLELEAGNLYRHIRRLEGNGCLAPAGRRPAREDDERRIYYRLTPFGRRVLASEMIRLRSMVRLAEERRIISPARS
jgi:PadR family transcriptional regulator